MSQSTWTFTTLGSTGNWHGGGTPSKAIPAFWTAGTIPWVSAKDMKVFRLHGAEDAITALAVASSAARVIPAGAVLLVVRSGILEHTLPVAVTSVPVTVNQDLKAIIPTDQVAPDFLAYYLTASGNQILRDCSKSGTTVASIEMPALKAFRFPLPPLAEQHAIVAAIEAHFSRLDATVASLTRAKANLKFARASVLKAAVEGRLVPTEAELARTEGREYEPASVLLERILAERKAKWELSGKKGKYREPVAPESDESPALPEGWVWASMDSLADIVGGITKDAKKTIGRRVAYLRVANVQRGRLDLSEIKTVVATEDRIAKLRLRPGDILLNEGGDRNKLGRGWVWHGELAECIHQNHVFRARLWLDAFDSRYLSHYANTEGDRYFRKEGKQTTNLASISLSKVKRLPVALPPAAEQARILAEADRRLSVFDATEARLDLTLVRCASLRQSTLKQAFEGRLVSPGIE